MKHQGLISENDDILIIDENDWSIVRNDSMMMLLKERKILLGFSGFDC